MSFTEEYIIEDINKRNEEAYEKIREGVEELAQLSVAESAILMSVRMIYADYEEEKEKEK